MGVSNEGQYPVLLPSSGDPLCINIKIEENTWLFSIAAIIRCWDIVYIAEDRGLCLLVLVNYSIWRYVHVNCKNVYIIDSLFEQVVPNTPALQNFLKI